MHRLDPKTGKLSSEDTKVYSLATRKRPDSSPPIVLDCRVTGRQLRRPL